MRHIPHRPARTLLLASCVGAAIATPAAANEIWVLPTYQADTGGIGVGVGNGLWPATPAGAVRLSFVVPDDLQQVESSKIALIPGAATTHATLVTYVCSSGGGGQVGARCAGPFNHDFTGGASQLVEVNIANDFGTIVDGSSPGASYVAVLAFTTPSTSTDHIAGMRFTYVPSASPGSLVFGNTAVGQNALASNVEGIENTAVGAGALQSDAGHPIQISANGSYNTALGAGALSANVTGDGNVALGFTAGSQATGNNNIYIGASVPGVAGENGTLRIGAASVLTRAFIAGIRGVTPDAGDGIGVVIDSNGQLGTQQSSRRYKEDIQDMGDASRGLFKLRPVTFRYTQATSSGTKPLQYGLIAEEVADVFPNLVVRGADGHIETVQYEKVNAMLLNEVQKQQKQIDALGDELAALTKQLRELEAERVRTTDRQER